MDLREEISPSQYSSSSFFISNYFYRYKFGGGSGTHLIPFVTQQWVRGSYTSLK